MLISLMLAAALCISTTDLARPDPAGPAGPAGLAAPIPAIDAADDPAPTADDGQVSAGETVYFARSAADLDLAALAYAIELDLAEAGLARKQQDPKKALDAATRAWIAATCVSPFEQQEDLLARAVSLRVELLAELGRTEQALSLAVEILIPEGEAVDAAVTEAPESLLTLRRQVALDPRVASARRQVEAVIGLARPGPKRAPVEEYVLKVFGPRSEAMDAGVLDGLLSGDAPYLRSLGSRGAPSLAAITLYGPDYYTIDAEWTTDPLAWLARLDELGAARLMLDHMEGGGTRFRLRALDAMRESQVWQQIRWFSDSAGRTQADPNCWLDVLAAIVRDPDALRRCTDEIRDLARRDGFHPALQEALIEAIQAGGAEIANVVARATNSEYRRSSATSFLRHALGPATGEARVLVAEALAREVDAPELRALYQDVDPNIRRLVAMSMGGMVVRSEPASSAFRIPTITDQDRARLRDLSADPDPSVQHKALLAILALDPAFEAAFFDSFLDRASADDRGSLVSFDHPDRALTGRVLAAVARGDKSAYPALDRRLLATDLRSDLERVADAFEVRLFETAPPISLSTPLAQMGFGSTAEGVRLLIHWGLKHHSPATLDQGLDGAIRSRHTDVIAELPLPDLRRVFLETYGPWTSRVVEPLRGHIDVSRALYLSILGDAALPRALRLSAIREAMITPDDTVERAFLAFLADPTWSNAPPTPAEQASLKAVIGDQPTRMNVLAAVAADREISDPVCWSVFQTDALNYRVKFPASVARPVLDRFLNNPALPDDQVGFVLNAMRMAGGLSPEELPAEHLLQALKSTDARFVSAALGVMEQRRDDAFLDALGACVRGEGLRCPNPDENLQVIAARALSGYHDPRVVPYLLAGLKVGMPSQGSRLGETIREALEIQELYQEKTAAFASGRPRVKISRETSIALLVDQLHDENDAIRRSAIAALGSFGSVEALPYLIDLLAEEDATIQQAAQAAISEIKTKEAMKGVTGH